MHKCRLSSFLHTKTTALHHGLWLGQIAPASNISFIYTQASSSIRGGILWNLSLKGSSSTTLISCFAKSVKPNSPGSMEKMSWYSVNRAWAATQFLFDHLSRPYKSSCWKSNFFLCWIPYISSIFSRVSGVTFTGGTAFAATTWVTLTPLVIVIQVAIRFYTTTPTCLLPEITSVYIFTTIKPWGKWVPSPPFRDWVITCMLSPRSRVFVWLCIILD